MKIEATISTRPFTAMARASLVRPGPERPRVSVRKMGALPSGLTIGNNAPTTSNVFAASSLNALFTGHTSCGDATRGRNRAVEPVRLPKTGHGLY
jgi:hypothetical protein